MGFYATSFYFLIGNIQLNPAYYVGCNVGCKMVSTGVIKLKAIQVKKASKTKRYSDSNCLYLYGDDQASKRWVLQHVLKG